jgi:hypothetical protein
LTRELGDGEAISVWIGVERGVANPGSPVDGELERMLIQ